MCVCVCVSACERDPGAVRSAGVLGLCCCALLRGEQTKLYVGRSLRQKAEWCCSRDLLFICEEMRRLIA